jgi:hypothetical protein
VQTADGRWITRLAPGQSTTTYMFVPITSNKLNDLNRATFRIVEVSKYGPRAVAPLCSDEEFVQFRLGFQRPDCARMYYRPPHREGAKKGDHGGQSAGKGCGGGGV